MPKFKPTSKSITIENSSSGQLEKLANLAMTVGDEIEENGRQWWITATNDRGKIRTLAQNSLYATYLDAIKTDTGFSDEDLRVEHKRCFGLQILYAQAGEKRTKDDSEVFTKAALDAQAVMETLRIINFKHMNDEQKNKVLKVIPCTRIMTTKNFAKFLVDIEQFYQYWNGLRLESINEAKRNEALGDYFK